MGCIVALLALISPRLAFALVWLFSDRVDIAYDGFFVPFLGLVFLPWTALVYTFAYAPVRGVSGLGWVFVTLALIADLASYGAGESGRRSR
jgi:hypothetical protein